MSHRPLLDGVGISIKDDTDRLLIESSGERTDHAEEDTIKQISNTGAYLRVDMKKYQLSSFNTFRRRHVFGIQLVHDTITLTTTCMINKERYAFIIDQQAHLFTRGIFYLLKTTYAG